MVSVGKTEVQTAVNLAVGARLQQWPLLYNLHCVLKLEQCEVDCYIMHRGLEEIDNRAPLSLCQGVLNKEKKARKHQRGVRMGLIDAAVEVEGAPGAF